MILILVLIWILPLEQLSMPFLVLLHPCQRSATEKFTVTRDEWPRKNRCTAAMEHGSSAPISPSGLPDKGGSSSTGDRRDGNDGDRDRPLPLLGTVKDR